MGSIQKIGEDYFIEFYARGLKYQQKIGPDMEMAQKALESIETKIAKGEAATLVRDVDHDIFFEDFLHYASQRHTPKSLARYKSVIEDFKSFLRQECPTITKLSEVTPRIIEQYKSLLIQQRPTVKKGLSPKAINLTLFFLRDIFEYAIKLGFLNDNPTLHIRLVKVSSAPIPTILTDEELKLVFNGADSYLWFLLEFILVTGMRVQKLIDLKWSDIDWPQGLLRIPGTPDTISLNGRGLEILKQLQTKKQRPEKIFTDAAGCDLSIDRLTEALSRLNDHTGIKKKLSYYAFRHTFARNLVKKGVAIAHLYKFLGFTDIAKIIIYSRFLSDYWEREINKE